MPSGFDPYHKWLGIPPEEQPPDHYRLLGVRQFESDAEAIEHAADQRMAHLRTFQAGRNSSLSQQLLNEVSAARVCLLNPAKKAAYDQQLREQMPGRAVPGAGGGLSGGAIESTWAGLYEQAIGELPVPTTGTLSAQAARRRRKNRLIGLLIAGIAGMTFLMVLIWILGSETRPGARSVAKPARPHVAPPGTFSESAAPPSPRPGASPVAQAPKPAAPSRPVPTVVQDGRGTAPTGREAPARKMPAAPPTPAPDMAPPSPAAPTSDTPSTSPPSPIEDAKLPVPSKADQDAVLDQLNKDPDYVNAKTPEDKLRLAERLSELGRRSEEARERFVLLQKAAELASGAGNLDLAFSNIDGLADQFHVEGLKLKQKHLLDFAAEATVAARIGVFVESAGVLIEQLAAEERFEEATDLVTRATKLCQKPQGQEFRQRVREYRSALQKLHRQWDRLQKMRETLKTSPEDETANLAVGRWYCFTQGDWKQGLPLLAKGNDAALRSLAEHDLDAPGDSAAGLKLADAWWDAAQRRGGDEKEGFLFRARYWYQQVDQDRLSEVEKERVGKRLLELVGVPDPGLRLAPSLRDPAGQATPESTRQRPRTRGEKTRPSGRGVR